MKVLTKVLLVIAIVFIALMYIYWDFKEQVSTFKVAAWGLVFVTATVSKMYSRRWRKSRKAWFYMDGDKNSYENRPVTVFAGPDGIEKDYYWTYLGASAFPPEQLDAVIVSLRSMVHVTGTHLGLKGKRVEVNSKQLMQYLKGDKVLFEKITSNLTPRGKIYIVVKLPVEVEKSFYSLKGGYPIGTDTFNQTIKIVYEHWKGITETWTTLKESMQRANDFAGDHIQKMKNVAKDVNETIRTNVPKETPQTPPVSDRRENEY